MIVAAAMGLLSRLKPAGNVGPTRYRIGLLLFVAPLLLSWVAAYDPSWMPGGEPARLWVNLAFDLTLLVSLVVLGGDFWDKLRALFVHDARAVFPPAPVTPPTSAP